MKLFNSLDGLNLIILSDSAFQRFPQIRGSLIFQIRAGDFQATL